MGLARFRYAAGLALPIVLVLVVFPPLIASAGPEEPSEPGSQPYRWVLECIDCPKQFSTLTDRSLRLDSAGHPHIAYGQDHLYYASYDGATWQYETADDSSGVGRYASLFLDAEEQPHISYFDSVNEDLKYAYRNDAGWQIETVDSEGCVGLDTTIALDSEGDVHIAYSPCGPYLLVYGVKYARRHASQWQLQVIGEEGIRDRGASLALDSQGYPHLSYEDPNRSTLWYTVQTDQGWHTEPVTNTQYGGYNTSLVLDKRDDPKIAYEAQGDLYFASRRDPGWQIEILDTEGYVGLFPSLALDAMDSPHISYFDLSNDDLKYAQRDASGWLLMAVPGEGDAGWFSSLALDADGHPHIAHLDQGDDHLVYSHQGDTGWQSETVDSGGHVGMYADLALDQEGHPHVSYYDVGGGMLKVAYRGDEGWHSETVDGPGVGRYTSVAVGADDRVHISYQDFKRSVLKYAVAAGQGWTTETVDSQGSPGYESSITLDANGEPHISYLETGEADLRYAFHGAGGWQVETVDAAIDAVWDSSLALDTEDWAHISYFSMTDWDLKHAKRRSDGWRTSVLVRDEGLGGPSCDTSLALDGDSLPHIGYNTCAWAGSRYCLPEALKYAYQSEDGWRFETVDSEGNVGAGVSLALDQGGFAHMAYGSYAHDAFGFGYVPDDVRYAYQDASGWHRETVDDEGMVGGYISLVLDDAGFPHIVYYDQTDGDLMYARRKTYRCYLPLAVGGP